MPKRYNHAYTLGFQVISDHPDADDVTNEMLLHAILARIADLTLGKDGPERCDMVEACDAPYDTMDADS